MLLLYRVPCFPFRKYIHTGVRVCIDTYMCIYRERERGRERDREEGKQIIIGMYIKRSTKRHTGDLTDPSGKGLRVSSLPSAVAGVKDFVVC